MADAIFQGIPSPAIAALAPGYIYDQPNESSTVVGSYRKGRIVRLPERVNGEWYKVAISEGRFGYVPSRGFRTATDLDEALALKKPECPKEAAPWLQIVAGTKNSEFLDPDVIKKIIHCGPDCLPAIAYELRQPSSERLSPVKLHLVKLLAEFGVDSVDTAKALITDGNGLERDAGTLTICLQLAQLDEELHLGRKTDRRDLLRARLHQKDIEDLLSTQTKDIAGYVAINATQGLSLLNSTEVYEPLRQRVAKLDPMAFPLFAHVAHHDDVAFICKCLASFDKDESNKSAMGQIINGFGGVYSEASQEILRNLLSSPSPSVRGRAVLSLAQFDDPHDLKFVQGLIKDPDIEVAIFALLTAFHLGDDGHNDLIRDIAKAKNPQYRSLVAKFLVNRQGNPFLELMETLAKDNEDQVRLILATELERSRGASVLPILNLLIKDPAPTVKHAAQVSRDRIVEFSPSKS